MKCLPGLERRTALKTAGLLAVLLFNSAVDLRSATPAFLAKEDPEDQDAAFEEQKAKYEEAKAKYEEAKSNEENPKEEKFSDPRDLAATILEFGPLKSKKTVPFLIGLIDEGGSPFIIGSVVKALGKQGTWKAVSAIVTKAIPRLIEDTLNLQAVGEALANPLEAKAEKFLLRSGLTPVVRSQPEALKLMIDVIAGLKDKSRFSVLSRELRSSREASVQIAILRVYAKFNPKESARDALSLVRSRDVEVATAALEVLLRVKAKSSSYASKYAQLLKSKEWRVRALAVDLLAMAGHKNLLKLLLRYLEDENDRVKIAVVAALLDSEDPKVIEPLIAAIDKNTGRVQDDILDVLIRLTGVNMGFSSVQWESWWGQYKDEAKIHRRNQEEFAKLKIDEKAAKDTLVYHGIRVLSWQCAFIMDTSESMLEKYRRKDSDEEDIEGEDGGTVVEKPLKGRAGKEDEQSKMDYAKEELVKVLKALQKGVLFNVVAFNTMIDAWNPVLEKLDTTSRLAATQFVETRTPGGLTNLYGSIERAFADERVDTIYLLSDGAPTNGRHVKPAEILEAVQTLNRTRKIKINTIGFNLKPNERQLMEDLAEANFGVFIAR